MRIACFFIGWNIESTIALTIRHYKSFCDKIIFLDNYSTDNSIEKAKSMEASVIQFGQPGILDDGEYVNIKNTCWKDIDCDYVIICDNDEILWMHNISSILQQEKAHGTTIFKIKGYSMFSYNLPWNDFLELNHGYADNKYSKTVIFDPKAVTDINYIYGCHEANPAGALQWSHVTIPLYHYMAIGGPERMITRHAEYAKRLSPLNKKLKLGHEYTFSAESKRKWFREQFEKSAPLF